MFGKKVKGLGTNIFSSFNWFSIFFVTIGIVCFLFFFILKNNSRCCSLYSLSSYDDKYLINGFAVKKNDFNYIVISAIGVNRDVDLEVYSFEYSFYSDGLLLYKNGDTASYVHRDSNQLYSLNDLLKNIKVIVNSSFNTSSYLPFFRQMYLEIYYIDRTLTRKLLVIPIEISKG